MVVFPECSVTGYFDNEYMQGLSREKLQSAERAVAQACREHQVYAIVGMPVRDGEKLYNSAIVAGFDLDRAEEALEVIARLESMQPRPSGLDPRRIEELRRAVERAGAAEESEGSP